LVPGQSNAVGLVVLTLFSHSYKKWLMLLLDKSSSAVPLYFRVTELRERILSGEWPCGSRIPGEVDLATAFGVSVITIRQAMTHLMHDGYIERHRAKGSFVSQQVPRRQNISLNVEVDDLMHIGPETRFRLYSVDYVTATPALAQKLGLETNERIKRVVRIRIEQ
jgi:GntR family transcriptional regulator